MAPGSEPILLDLEKLFLLSDSMENLNLYGKFEISEPEKNRCFFRGGRPTGDGKKIASNFLNIFRTRISQVFGIICISGGYQDLPPGFY